MNNDPTPTQSAPQPTLRVIDAVALIIGLVIGMGIFRLPSLVAGNTDGFSMFILAWVLGGVISLIGALCYAELASSHPNAGGDYYFLTRAFGREIGFLFGWARMAVIQPGAIAMLAFVFGDYASEIFRLGEHSPSIYALLAAAGFTALNITGMRQGKWTQHVLVALNLLGLAVVIAVGLLLAAPAPAEPSAPGGGGGAAFGLAMVFVLLVFGGWNEAAYISAELKDVKRNMSRALIFSIGLITLIYLLVNLAYWKGLGGEALAQSSAVAADLIRPVLGAAGVVFISLLICISALSSINATVITGGRTNYALGRDNPLFGFLGRWHGGHQTPVNALLFQGLITLGLIVFGGIGRQGFVTMVEYTAPVFWSFFLLAGLSLFVLRLKDGIKPGAFQVPLFPVLPLVFCATSIYMLHSSLAYTGVGALVGVGVLLLGIPLLLFKRPPAQVTSPEPGDTVASR